MVNLKIGINGFGRIGKILLRIASEKSNIDVVAINDPYINIDDALYMLKYDTVHGRFNKGAYIDGQYLVVNNKKIKYTMESEIKNINWLSAGAEIICEASGVFTDNKSARIHIKSGAKKVIITGPSKDCPMFVMGVNEKKYDKNMDVVSNASCTTNCLAPLAKLINDNFGIDEGLMTTIHAQTSSQSVVDSVNNKNIRLGRSGSQNIIPSSTGAAKAVGAVIPELEGKITGMSLRVPTINVSVVDFTVKLSTRTTYDKVIETVKNASLKEYSGIIGYEEDEMVSSDFIGDQRSCILDVKAGIMISDNFVKLIAWYDNEWAYSVRVIELAEYISKK